MTYPRFKRALDVALSATLLVLAAPLLLVIALVVRIGLGSPVLFRQARPGRHEQPFELLKFRTMMDVDHAAGRVSDDDRMTRIGRVLRSTSLDELPTLLNVLRGDMSLVGPRPLLMSYLPLYSAEQRRRHTVRPGVTGLAQVRGRNLLSWDEKFASDLEYVESVSFPLDVRILLQTVAKVLRREGIAAEGRATTDVFRGRRDRDD